MSFANQKIQAILGLRGLVAQLLVGILEECDADKSLIEAVQSLNGEAADQWFANSGIDPQLKVHLAKVIEKAFHQFAILEGIDASAVIEMTDEHVDVFERIVYEGIKQAIAFMGAPRDGQDKELRWEENKQILALLDEDKWDEVNDLLKQNRSNFAPDQLVDVAQLATLHKSYVRFTSAQFESYRMIFVR